MEKIKVGLIGYGRSGRDIHNKYIKLLPDMYEIAAYVDADADRRALIQSENGVQAYENYESLYDRKDIGLVVNASYSHFHQPISIDMLKHGFNVLSEKPAAANTTDFAALLDAERGSGKRFFAFQQYRFSPAYNKIREVIASGTLGRIVQINMHYEGFMRRWDWQTLHSWAGGSLLNTGPHPVDLSLELMGFPQDVNVLCVMDNAHNAGDGEDYDKLILHAKGYPVADIEISSCRAFPVDTYLIQGTGGSLRGDSKRLEWRYYVDADEPARPLVTGTLKGEGNKPIYCRERLTMYTQTWEAPEGMEDGTAKGTGYYKALYRALTAHEDFRVKNDQIMLQMRVMEQAHRQNEHLFAKK